MPLRASKYTNEQIDILRLIRSENIGARTFYDLVKFCAGDLSNALKLAQDLSVKGGKNRPINICSVDDVMLEIKKHDKIGARLVTYKDSCYPNLLKQIPDAPPVLSVLGNPKLLKNKLVSIVGARNASINGKNLCSKISSKLHSAGFTVVSGLARGIDTEAHNASIDSTIAVIAGGINHVYPVENRKIYDTICKKGLVIAELPIDSTPSASHFPQRNRIIAGLSRSTIVIEASVKSGSLITANLAVQYNREVFSVPGYPLDYRSTGVNQLIKEGAHIVHSLDDLVEQLVSIENNQHLLCESDTKPYQNSQTIPHVEDDVRQKLLSLLNSCPISIDELYNESGMSFPIIHTILLQLELAGRINRHPGNMISLSQIHENCYS